MDRQTAVIPIDKEYLHKLKEDSNSCVEAHKDTKHLSLHPFQLTDESAAIKDILNKGIAQYDKKLNGILLGYENITLLDPIAAVPADSCCPHFNIEAKFYVFKPVLEKVLVGVVNKTSKDHVGCLVHKTFNVSLPKPKDTKRWIGEKIQIGQEVEFKITKTDLLSKLPYICGEILSIVNEDSGISAGEELVDPKPNVIKKFDDSDNEEVTKLKKRKRKNSDGDVSLEISKKQRKNKKKDVDSPPPPEEYTVQTPPKKKKRSKDASRKIDFSMVDDSHETTLHNYQSEEYPPKKTKKHKKKVKEEST